MSKLRLTVLVENTARSRGLLAEHGLAFWIELGKKHILFDTGQADIECRQPDPLTDDQALFVETEPGIIVITGCAHAGVITTLQYVRELVPERPFYAVIGGMHLVKATGQRMDKTVAALHELNVQHLFPLHCTGFPAAARLWTEFPERVAQCPVGTKLQI